MGSAEKILAQQTYPNPATELLRRNKVGTSVIIVGVAPKLVDQKKRIQMSNTNSGDSFDPERPGAHVSKKTLSWKTKSALVASVGVPLAVFAMSDTAAADYGEAALDSDAENDTFQAGSHGDVEAVDGAPEENKTATRGDVYGFKEIGDAGTVVKIVEYDKKENTKSTTDPRNGVTTIVDDVTNIEWGRDGYKLPDGAKVRRTLEPGTPAYSLQLSGGVFEDRDGNLLKFGRGEPSEFPEDPERQPDGKYVTTVVTPDGVDTTFLTDASGNLVSARYRQPASRPKPFWGWLPGEEPTDTTIYPDGSRNDSRSPSKER